MMTREEYLAAPAPRVEEATVERASDVEPAAAPSAAFSEAANVEPASPVEPATTDYYCTPSASAATREVRGSLPTKAVRGRDGADFEAYAGVVTGRVRKNFVQLLLPCLYDDRDFVTFGEVKKYVIVKDGLAYVYVFETDPSPLFAVELQEYYPVQEDPKKPDRGSVTVNPLPNTNLPPPTMKTILLKNKTTDHLEFQFTFDQEKDPNNLAQMFFDLVSNSKKKHEAMAKDGPDKEAKAKTVEKS